MDLAKLGGVLAPQTLHPLPVIVLRCSVPVVEDPVGGECGMPISVGFELAKSDGDEVGVLQGKSKAHGFAGPGTHV